MRPVALAGILASTTILSGCAGTIAGISLSSLSSFAGIASTLFTGADLGEHAASIVTGKDCRFSEGLLREDRDVCEEPGSVATRDDFHGIFVDRIDADGTVIFAAPKYMPAGVGAGENENDPDQVWAEIKSQKAKEEGERQVARARSAQTIDVAALATGSLSPESLAFLPAGMALSELSDGDTASQTAARTRPVVNAAEPVHKGAMKEAAAAPVEDEPAIDETALTAPLKAARENGQGGPLITTMAASAPVVSKLINGEPVVILRLGPIFGGVMSSSEATSAEPSEFESSSPAVALPAASSAPSPLAILNRSQPATLPALKVAVAQPSMTEARPRTKPSAAELAAALAAATAEKEAAAKAKLARQTRQDEEAAGEPADVFQPPANADVYASSTAPDLMAVSPVQAPDDISAAAPASDPSSDATTGPAPLFPIAQP